MPARRPWGWIAVVLLIDLGLAAAGVWMLTAGLDDGSPAAGSTVPSPTSGSAAPLPPETP